MTGNKAGKRRGRNEIPKSATSKQDGAVVDREFSEVEHMSIQVLVEGVVSGALKSLRRGRMERCETENHRRDGCRPDYSPSHHGE